MGPTVRYSLAITRVRMTVDIEPFLRSVAARAADPAKDRGLCCVPASAPLAVWVPQLLAALAQAVAGPVLLVFTEDARGEVLGVEGLPDDLALFPAETAFDLASAVARGATPVSAPVSAVCALVADHAPFGVVVVVGTVGEVVLSALLPVRRAWARASWIAVFRGHPASTPDSMAWAFADHRDPDGLLACMQSGPAVFCHERHLVTEGGGPVERMSATAELLKAILDSCSPGEHVLVLVTGDIAELVSWLDVPVHIPHGGTDDSTIWEMNVLREDRTPALCIGGSCPPYAGVRWRALVWAGVPGPHDVAPAFGQLLADHSTPLTRVDVFGVGFDPRPLVLPELVRRR